MHTIESTIFVMGRSVILFPGEYVCTFQPANFTGWGSEGVKVVESQPVKSNLRTSQLTLSAVVRNKMIGTVTTEPAIESN